MYPLDDRRNFDFDITAYTRTTNVYTFLNLILNSVSIFLCYFSVILFADLCLKFLSIRICFTAIMFFHCK